MPLPTRIASAIAAGETVITSSARAARALRRQHGEAQRALGLAAWKSADILDWDSWLNRLWQKHLRAGRESRLLLSHAQEHQVWALVVEPDITGKLLISVLGVSELAQEAYALLCNYRALAFVRGSATESQDVEDFRRWARTFEQRCSREQWLSRSQLALELHDAVLKSDPGVQERFLLTGFDRTTPAQDYLLEACRQRGYAVQLSTPQDEPAVSEPLLVEAPSRRDEIYTCALWVRTKLETAATSRIAVVAPNVGGMRAEIERIFREVLAPQSVAVGEREAPIPFEFSLGLPLATTPMARAALLLLRWLNKSLAQDEANWLMLSGFLCTDADELLAVARFDARQRQQAMPQPEQDLDTLLQSLNKHSRETQPLEALRERLWKARRLVGRDKSLSFAEWAEVAEDVLQAVQWPGAHPLQSEEFQILARWAKVLDTVATLSFQGSDVTYAAFLEVLEQQAKRTIFAPESNDAPIQILGPLEAAGLTFDALWFLGADDASWPAPARPHPFLNRGLQRDKGMPHGSSDLDFALAQLVTQRLQSAAGQYVFSYSAQNAEGVCRPSTLLVFDKSTPAGALRTALGESKEYGAEHEFKNVYEDHEPSAIAAWPPGRDAGGSEVLKDQAACAFRSFAKRRLQARAIDENDWGLGPMHRGNVVHKILETLWKELLNRDALVSARQRNTLATTVAKHVTDALQQYRKDGPKRDWNQAYLDAESQRIASLIEQWLAYEEERADFVVEAFEEKRTATVGELKLQLRVDRIDHVADGRVIIDYKTGQVKTGVWAGPRPSEPQLPIYASYGNVEDLQGVLLGRVVLNQLAFIGRMTDGDAIMEKLRSEPFGAETLREWQGVLLKLAEQFLRGEAQVDPKDYPKTCQYCDLPGLCRIAESDRAVADEDGDEAGGESGG